MRDLEEGDPEKIGSFRLLARLGSGGMGTVYLAEREGRQGQVAVKTIRSEFAQEEGFRRRFAREATAASCVRSPYTVRVISFDTQALEPWIATEYVEGLSVLDRVRSKGPLGLTETVELALGLSFGLASIHKAGLVHRDLKPGNILLTEDGPKIIDFGLAYAADFSHATHTGAVLGTPGYFSPEQVQGQPVSPASDIFALGAVLTFASTGDHAFRGVNALTAQYHVVHEEPQLTDVPEELQALIAACMHKDSRERPPVNVLLAHLTAFRTYGHRRAGPTSLRTRRPYAESGVRSAGAMASARRRRAVRRAALGISGVALLFLGTLIGPWIDPAYYALARNRDSGAAGTGSPVPPMPTGVASAYAGWDLGPLEFERTRGRCMLGSSGDFGSGLTVTGYEDYSILLKSTAESPYGFLVEAEIETSVVNRGEAPYEPFMVYLRLPNGEVVSLSAPEGKYSLSFQWPDILKTARIKPPYGERDPVDLAGSYTIVIYHGIARACSGFEGDPKDWMGKRGGVS
ncbi:serine/threonine-protein kinase [Streptomyces sp. NPDC094049]|uniref:serine/threonine-protein kinase n=1 Tax=Streptomyces sp. NPDC094049 TaxID=3154987 RepID=UPI00332D9787